jgi:hypothetical protein
MPSPTTPISHLNRWERRTILGLGALLLLLALYTGLAPASRLKTTFLGTGVRSWMVLDEVDRPGVAIAFLAAGMLFLGWGLNGLRLSKVQLGGMDAGSAAQAAQALDAAGMAAMEVSVKSAHVPRPDDAMAEELTLREGDAWVFDRVHAPLSLISDVVKHWPKELEHQKPGLWVDLEFVSKPKGKANSVWTVKFKHTPPIRVTYGSKGKKKD